MSAFDEAREVEREGWLQVESWVRSATDGRYAAHFEDRAVQRAGYDLTAFLCGADKRVELKCERADRWGNFFLETWSNKAFGRARDGWMMTCTADVLLYYFLDPGDLYVIDHRRLWAWFFGEPPVPPNWWRYEEKPQQRFSQPNKTFGCPVPIGDIAEQVGLWHGRRQADGSFRGVRDTRKEMALA